MVLPSLKTIKCKGVIGTPDYISEYTILYKLLEGKEILLDRTSFDLVEQQKVKRTDDPVMFTVSNETEFFSARDNLYSAITERDFAETLRTSMGEQGEYILYHYVLGEIAFMASAPILSQ